jgi:hypothetical protein
MADARDDASERLLAGAVVVGVPAAESRTFEGVSICT